MIYHQKTKIIGSGMVKLTNKEKRIFDFLKQQAIDVDAVKSSRIVAAVVLNNQVISVGNNKMKSHPFAAKYSKNEEAIYLHAETDAIKKALNHVSPSELSKATLYIQRVKRPDPHKRKGWTNGLSKPCKGCMRAVVEFDFKRVVYSTDEGYEVL